MRSIQPNRAAELSDKRMSVAPQGDLMRLTVLGQPIYIISSYKIATDLLEKRSLIYSDRPIMRFAQELSVMVLKKVFGFF